MQPRMTPNSHQPPSLARTPTKLARALLFSVILLPAGVRPAGAAQPPHPVPLHPPRVIAPAGPAVKGLDLTECLHLAYQNHPRIAAQQASLAAAEDGLRALEKLRLLAQLLAPELPIRHRQAALGLTAASAALDQAQRETAYAVTRTYF